MDDKTKRRDNKTYVMDSLKASMAWPYLRLRGQAMDS